MATLNNQQLQTLYAFRPAFSSLFDIWISDTGLNALATLQATGVKLPSETLNLERDKTTFHYKVKKEGSYQRINSVSITWREDENYSVKKFHEAWLRKVYDPVLDAYRAGAKPGLDFQVKMYKSDGTVADTAYLKNVIPQKWGDLDFSWGEEPKGINYTITYYVEEIRRAADPNIKMSGSSVNVAAQSYAVNDVAKWITGEWPAPTTITKKDDHRKEIFDALVEAGAVTPQTLLPGMEEFNNFTQFPGYEFGKTSQTSDSDDSKGVILPLNVGFDGTAISIKTDLNIPGAPKAPVTVKF